MLKRKMNGIIDNNLFRVCIAIVMLVCTGCAADGDVVTDGIASAWKRRDTATDAESTPEPRPMTNRVPNNLSLADLATKGNTIAHVSDDHDAIATVNGKIIKRSLVVELLLRGHGPNLLKQLAVYELARTLAADRGLTLSSTEVEREYDRTLNRLANPLVAIATNQVDRQEAEALLATILAQRNISRDEFDITVRRNALLRKLVNAEQHFTEAQIKAEHALMIARKAEVRHIQIATHAELSRVLDRLAGGEDFAEVAQRYSANTASAQRGGLLLPFAQQDDRVPNLLRKTAFDLQPGQISDPIRMGAWYHIVKLERMVPAKPSPVELMRDETVLHLKDRLADAAMQRLYEKLLREAQIEIHDPILRQAYEQAGSKQSR